MLNHGEQFIATMERTSERGDADYIERNMAQLEAIIRRMENRQYKLAQLQYRARVVRDRHE